jgi:hypothetical protein
MQRHNSEALDLNICPPETELVAVQRNELIRRVCVSERGAVIVKVWEKVKVKVKFSLCLTKHHSVKTYWGSGGIAPRILNFGTSWKWVVSFTHRLLYSREKTPPRCPLYRRLFGLQNRCGRGGEEKESLPLPETERCSSSCSVIILIVFIARSPQNPNSPKGIMGNEINAFIRWRYSWVRTLATCYVSHKRWR